MSPATGNLANLSPHPQSTARDGNIGMVVEEPAEYVLAKEETSAIIKKDLSPKSFDK